MSVQGLTGSRIRDRRLALGMRQRDLAGLAGISPSYLNLIEHNRRPIAGKLLSDIARELQVDIATLSEGAEAALIAGLRDAASGTGEDKETASDPELSRIEEFAGRFPGWAGLLETLKRQNSALGQTVETLSDRLTHDPFLSESLHEILTTVTAIRSTSSILTGPGEVDANWQARFLKNIFEDSVRLAEGAQTLVSHLEQAGQADKTMHTPGDELDRFLTGCGHHVKALEGNATVSASSLAAGREQFSTALSRAHAQTYLSRYKAEARILPVARLQEAIAAVGFDPARLAVETGVAPAIVFRRLAQLPDEDASTRIGLVACDGSGALTFRKPLADFAMPQSGPACPLWPLYRALAMPATPVRARVQQAGRPGASFTAFALSQQSSPDGFDGPVLSEVQMLIVPDGRIADTGNADTGGALQTVGATCRICTRRACVARSEASVLADGF